MLEQPASEEASRVPQIAEAESGPQPSALATGGPETSAQESLPIEPTPEQATIGQPESEESVSHPSMVEAAVVEQASAESAIGEQPIPGEAASGGRDSTAEFMEPLEEELPDWLKEAAQLEEPPAEAAAPQGVASTHGASKGDQLSESSIEPLVVLSGEQRSSDAGALEESSIPTVVVENQEQVLKTSSVPLEPVPTPSEGMATAQTGDEPDHVTPQARPAESQTGQLDAEASKGQEATTAGVQSAERGATPAPLEDGQPNTTSEAGIFPDWIRELVPPGNLPFPGTSQTVRTEPPQIRDDEREELPEWLRESAPGQGMKGEPPSEPDSGSRAATPRLEKTGWIEEAKNLGEHSIPREPLDEVTVTEGPLAGVRGILPLAIGVQEPHTVVVPSSRQTDGAHVFESVLVAAAESALGSAPAVQKGAPRSWSKWWIYPAVLLAALIPFFVPSNLAGLGLKVNNTTPTAKFYDVIQSLAPGSTVLLAFDYDTGQAVELDPAARVVVQDLARRQINVVALTTLPTGVQIAQRILNEAARENPGWSFGENYVNAGYLPGGEVGLRALADNWLPASQEEGLAPLSLGQRVKSLKDLALAIEFAGSDESLRAWMEQVQPSHQVTFVAAVSAAVESQARNYLAANQLAAFLRGLGGAAEYELFSNQTGLNVRTVDAQSFSHLIIFAIVVLANLVFFAGRLRRT
jgi:hypothetical protein